MAFYEGLAPKLGDRTESPGTRVLDQIWRKLSGTVLVEDMGVIS